MNLLGLNKVKKILVASVLLLNAIPVISSPAKAGVMQELVEVDADQRARDEAERVRLQEEYRKEAVQTPASVVTPAPEAPAPRITPQEPAKTTKTTIVTKSKTHVHDSAFCFICKVFGTIFGSTIGSVAGLVRGSVNKSVDHADGFSDGMGDGVLGNVVGKPAGAVTGFVTGAGTGLANGFVTGLTEGWSDPFSGRSFTLEGEFMDYDPYDFIGGGQ